MYLYTVAFRQLLFLMALFIGILKTGKQGTIAIGLVPKNYPPNRQPGWNVQSIGYHADDGG